MLSEKNLYDFIYTSSFDAGDKYSGRIGTQLLKIPNYLPLCTNSDSV